jgi:uncharacterized YccA/Bax inhibitor family protein
MEEVLHPQREAFVRTTNPVLTRLGQAADRQRSAGYAGGYGQPYPTAGDIVQAPDVRPMTLDDVVVKTVTLLGITGASAAAAWTFIPDQFIFGAWIGAALVGLVLGLVISFMRIANPALVVTYAVIEGVFVGLVSKFYQVVAGLPGIVLQAVVATFAVFFVMAILYKIRAVRATPRFTRGVIGAIVGVFAVMLINFVLSLFGIQTGLRSGGAIGIIFSLVCIVIAALSFVLNFAEIENGVRMGLPQRYSWTAAFGMLVGLIWLYLEILRLLSYLQGGRR